MSTAVLWNDFLLKSAKRQLGLKPTAQDHTVPREYLEELKKLLEGYPDEINFLIHRQPRLGYGYITCLREGCNRRTIELESSKDAGFGDGGITRGFGAFVAYQWHIRIAHKPKEEPPLPVIKAEPQPLTIKAEPKPLMIETKSQSPMIKREPLEDRVASRKRSGTLSVLREIAPKKIKAEPENPSITAVEVNHALPMSTEAIRDELTDLQAKINHLQPQLDRARRKNGKTTEQLTREKNLTSQLITLYQQKKELTEMIPAVSAPPNTMAGPSHQNGYVDGFTQPTQPLALVKPSIASVPVASGSNLSLNSIKDEHMDTDSDSDNVTPQPTSDMDHFHSFEDDNTPMLVDGANLGVDFYHYNTAKADDIKRYLEIAGNSDYFDGDAKVEASLKALGLPNLSTLLPGMQVALMPHQVIGVDWMLKQEACPSRRGGILADEMGLGKTIQVLAVMVANRPTDDQRHQVLVVAPLALLDQWQLEIELKTNCGFKCCVHHGQARAKRVSELREYDVIITTHSTLASEWYNTNFEEIWAKRKIKRSRRKNCQNVFIVEDSDSALKTTKKKKSTGVLYEIEWYRVVVDEAHYIRNKATRVSNAVVDLDATYRWCLTGTPIINTLSDAFGLIRFLQLRPWNDWKEFHEYIGRNEKKRPKLATDRLQTIFKMVLLRRNKDTFLDGKKLITLPQKTVELVKLEFCLEEREIYAAVETKSQQMFNRFLRAGTVLKNYHYVLVLLLRLRQICNHPALISEREEDLEAAGRTRADAEVDRAVKSFGVDFATKVRAKIRDLETGRMEAELMPDDGRGVQVEECPICFDVLSDGVVTGCCHIFCRECITGIFNNPPTTNAQDMKEDDRPCPSCRRPISSSKLYTLEAFNTPKQSGPSKNGKRRVSARPFEFAADDTSVDGSETDSEDDFIVPDDEEDHEPRQKKKHAKRNVILSDDEYDDVIIPAVQPGAKPKASVGEMNEYEISTKMQRMMDELITSKKSHPDQKTVVISQWTSYLDMLSRYLTNEGFAHVKYQGSMSRDERNRAVRAFMAKDNATVMLMSLKCGGVGLNLTRANRVISLDMAWSRAVDDQAFDRVHRLGQDREVVVKRLVITNTVEDRILYMQEIKKNLADGSLGEGSGQKMGRLSVKQLANLFGLDHRGNLL